MADSAIPSRRFRSLVPDDEWTGFRTGSWQVSTARSAEALKPYHATLLHAFATAARLDADVGISLLPANEREPEEHRSYRDLYHAVKRAAAALAQLGVRRGDRVLIVLPTSFEFVISFFAVEMLGAVPVPSYPPALLERIELALDRLRHIGQHAQTAYCITDGRLRPVLGALALDVPSLGHIVAVEELLEGDPSLLPRVEVSGANAGFIQYTSGSTGRPKGVLLAHDNIVANIHAIGQAMRVNHEDRVVSWLPLYHDMGLIGGLLVAIYWRLPLALMAPSTFLMRPSRWLWAIHRHRGTLSPAPNFAYGLACKRVRSQERVGLDLSSWRLAMNGAEPVNLRTLIDFEQAFAPHGFRKSAFLPVYGLAESSLAVSFSNPGDPLHYQVVDRAALASGRVIDSTGPGSMAIVSVGEALPGHEVYVLDERGRPLPEREVGHVVARGPSVMRGYYQDPKATAEVLRDGWLWTGDLGYFADGELYITGRAKDLIIIRGRNHYAEDLERVAERIEGVRAGGTAAFGIYDEQQATDLAVLVCETKLAPNDEPGRTTLVKAVIERIVEDVGVQIDEVVLVPPGTIPKTSSGKRQRALCRELYLEGGLAVTRTGRLRLMMVFARSRAGLVISKVRRMMAGRRAPS